MRSNVYLNEKTFLLLLLLQVLQAISIKKSSSLKIAAFVFTKSEFHYTYVTEVGIDKSDEYTANED